MSILFYYNFYNLSIRQITDYNDDYNTFDLVVSTDNFSQQVIVEKHISHFSVMIEDQQLEIFSDWEAGDTMMKATINGEDITVHVSQENECPVYYICTEL